MTFLRTFSASTPQNDELARLREENAQLQQKVASARERAAYAEGLLEATRTALAAAEARNAALAEELQDLRTLHASEKARADRFDQMFVDAWNAQAPPDAPRAYTAADLMNGRVPRRRTPKATPATTGGVQ